ncbi:hypothetical protein ACQPZP_43455 [Spirillospora sp. CA-142024]|uniref:hypothetical protein n=1 Tax=Spirillospora sp. CA-142024 TaxID=3240036 RepID=UPI003D8F5BF9
MDSSPNHADLAAIAGGGLLGGVLGGLTFAVTAALGYEAMPGAGEFAELVMQTGFYAALLAAFGTWMGEWHLSKARKLRWVAILDCAIILIIVGIQVLFDGDLVYGVADATGYTCGSLGFVFLTRRQSKRAAGSDNGTDGPKKALGDG